MRVPFSEHFSVEPDGTVVIIKPFRIGHVFLGKGIKITGDVKVAGIALTAMVGHDLEVEDPPPNEGAVRFLKGIY